MAPACRSEGGESANRRAPEELKIIHMTAAILVALSLAGCLKADAPEPAPASDVEHAVNAVETELDAAERHPRSLGRRQNLGRKNVSRDSGILSELKSFKSLEISAPERPIEAPPPA